MRRPRRQYRFTHSAPALPKPVTTILTDAAPVAAEAGETQQGDLGRFMERTLLRLQRRREMISKGVRTVR